MTVPARVSVTPAASELLDTLRAEHGPLMLHQSGGCCDGSSPMCYPQGEFMLGESDVFLGVIADDVPVYIGPRSSPIGRTPT